MSDVPDLETLEQEARDREGRGGREAAALRLKWAVMVWG